MICPFCSAETTPIDLKGKLFCENCGLALGESPSVAVPEISETQIKPETSLEISSEPTLSEPPVESIRQIHEFEATDEPEQTDKIGSTEIPISDEKTISELSSQPTLTPQAEDSASSVDEPLKKLETDELVIKKPTEEAILKQLNVDNSLFHREEKTLAHDKVSASNIPDSPETNSASKDRITTANVAEEPDYVSPKKYEATLAQPLPNNQKPITSEPKQNESALKAQPQRQEDIDKSEVIQKEPEAQHPQTNLSDESTDQDPINNNSQASVEAQRDNQTAFAKKIGDISPTAHSEPTPKEKLPENTEPANVGVELPATDNSSFTEKVKEMDTLGASGILLDILDDKAIEGEDIQKISSYAAAGKLLEENPDIFSSKPEIETTLPSPDKTAQSLNTKPVVNNEDISAFVPQMKEPTTSDPLTNSPVNPIKHLEFLDIKPPMDLPTSVETEKENLETAQLDKPNATSGPETTDYPLAEAIDPRHVAVKNYFNNIFETKK
ncbi:MAG: hypothetical protein WCI63_03965 [bacterium]